MKKFLYILLFFSILSGKIYAQYSPTYSQYLLNGMAINPAFAGSREVLSTCILYRNQWLGFDGAPITMKFSTYTTLRELTSAIELDMYYIKIGIY